MAKNKPCLYCAHGDNSWPMYVGNRRHDTADGCDKLEEHQALEREVGI